LLGGTDTDGRQKAVVTSARTDVIKVGICNFMERVRLIGKQILSPLLFVTLMNQVLKQPAREMVSEGEHSDTFAYADDIDLVT
jgi:hypothetical protein